MESNAEMSQIFKRIISDARIQKIDLNNPTNGFTVWADFQTIMKHCGSCLTLDEAHLLASEHINLRALYIVRGPATNFGIYRYEPGTIAR
jgi:hypothetical protein